METETVLRNFLSQDGAVRRSAEEQIENLQKSNPEAVLLAFTQAIRTSTDEGVRQTAAVLLRKIWSNDDDGLWAKLSPQTQSTLTTELLAALNAEPMRSARNAICEAVALIGMNITDDAATAFEKTNPEKLFDPVTAWPAMWQFMLTAVNSQNSDLQECALMLFERLSGFVVDMDSHFSHIREIFLARMGDASSSTAVRTAAARAAAGLLTHITRPSVAEIFAPLVPALLKLLAGSASSNDEEAAKQVSGVLIEAAEKQPSMFKPVLAEAVNLLCDIAKSQNVDCEIRANCLEVLVQLAENAAPIVRRMPHNGFVKAVLPVALSMCLEWGYLDDNWEAEWDAQEEEDEDYEADGRLVETGEEGLLRLASAIGHKRFLPVIKQLIAEAMSEPNSRDWRSRYAATTAIGQCADIIEDDGDEGAPLKEVAERLAAVVMGDPNMRVRYVALDCISAFADAQNPMFQIRTHSIVLPAMVAGLKDQSRRVRLAACRSFITYCHKLDTDFEPETLHPYLDGVIRQIVELLQVSASANDHTLQEASLTAISQVMAAAGSHSSPYYDILVPGLHQILSTPDTPPVAGNEASEKAHQHTRKMKGLALECLTIVGAAAGKEKFAKDAVGALGGIVSILQSLQAEKGHSVSNPASASDDPLQSYCWDALSRIAHAIGADEFRPYIGTIMPLLIAGAAAEPQIIMKKDVGDENELEYDESYLHFNDLKGRTMAISTSETEDKLSAIEALSQLFSTLHCPEMAHYAVPFLEAILTSITSPGMALFEDVRSSATRAMEDVFRCLASVISVADVEKELAAGFAEHVTNATSPPAFTGPAQAYVYYFIKSVQTLVSEAVEEESSEMLRTFVVGAQTLLQEGCRKEHFLGESKVQFLASRGPAFFVPILNNAQITAIVQHMKQIRQAVVQRRAVRAMERVVNEDDFDEEEVEKQEEAAENDSMMLFLIGETWGTLARTHGDKFLPAFSELLVDDMADWSHPHCVVEDRRSAIYLGVDLLEFLGDSIVDLRKGMNLSDPFITLIANELESPNANLRQAAAYGMGVAAESCRHTFPKHMPQIIAKLYDLIKAYGKQQDAAYDNAVVSLAKIAVHQYPHITGGNPAMTPAGCPSRAEILSGVLSHLPLKEDMSEFRVVLFIVCNLFEAKDTDLFPIDASGVPDLARATHFFKTLAFACNNTTTFIDDEGKECRERIAATLNWAQANLPQAFLQSVWTSLTEKEQKVLHKVSSTSTVNNL